jgi:hypothetical protein
LSKKKTILLYLKKFITMLVSSFNLSQSFNYTPYFFYKRTVQIRDKFFLYLDPVVLACFFLKLYQACHFPLCIHTALILYFLATVVFGQP